MENNLVSRGGLIINSTELGSNSDKLLVIDSTGEVKHVTNEYLKRDGSVSMTGNLTVGDGQNFPLINFGSASEARRLVRSGDDLKWQGDGSSAKVIWHEGNLTPNDYLKRDGSNTYDSNYFQQKQTSGTDEFSFVSFVDATNRLVRLRAALNGTNNASHVSQFELGEGYISASHKFTAPSFVKSGGQNNNVLLDGGGVKPINDFLTSGHEHDASDITSGVLNKHRVRHIDVPDTRDDEILPDDLVKEVQFDFKRNTTVGSPPKSGNSYVGVMSFAPYSDDSGGPKYQLSFGEGPELGLRQGKISSGWGSWNKLWHSGNSDSFNSSGTYSNVTVGSAYYADNSNTLDGLSSGAFVRSNATDTITGVVTVSNSTHGGFRIHRVGANAGIKYTSSDVSTEYWAGFNGSTGEFGVSSRSEGFNVSPIRLNSKNGNVYASDFVGTSDFRKKENIEILEPKPIHSLYKSFNFIEDETKQKRVGVIAQELEVNHPEFVRTDDEGTKSVSYNDLHSAEIVYLKKQNETLESKTKDLDMLVQKQQEEINELKEMVKILVNNGK